MNAHTISVIGQVLGYLLGAGGGGLLGGWLHSHRNLAGVIDTAERALTAAADAYDQGQKAQRELANFRAASGLAPVPEPAPFAGGHAELTGAVSRTGQLPPSRTAGSHLL